jgi:hypothetical protein
MEGFLGVLIAIWLLGCLIAAVHEEMRAGPDDRDPWSHTPGPVP